MSIIHYEHFDLYGTDINALLARGYGTQGALSSGNFSTSSRTGSQCFNASSSQQLLRWSAPAPLSVMGQGCAMLVVSTPTNNSFIQFAAGLSFGTASNANAIRIVPNGNFGFSVFAGTGSSTPLGSSVNGLISTGSFFWLEARVTSGAGTTGAVEVRLNGVQIINLTGLSLTENWITATIGSDNYALQPAARFDDWVVWDTAGSVNNSFLGDTFVLVAAPNADGTPSDWVQDSGANRFSRISETTPADASFITGNAVGDVNVFGHVALTLPTGSVAAVATQVRAFKTDAGSSSIQIGVTNNSQHSMSAELALATGAVVRSHIANLNPDGNVPWTQAAAQAAGMRFRRAA
jgi:hypothetical protein